MITPQDVVQMIQDEVIPRHPKTPGYFWATDHGLKVARWIAWGHSNSYWEKDWPEEQRKQVHRARAELLAITLSQC